MFSFSRSKSDAFKNIYLYDSHQVILYIIQTYTYNIYGTTNQKTGWRQRTEFHAVILKTLFLLPPQFHNLVLLRCELVLTSLKVSVIT